MAITQTHQTNDENEEKQVINYLVDDSEIVRVFSYLKISHAVHQHITKQTKNLNSVEQISNHQHDLVYFMNVDG